MSKVIQFSDSDCPSLPAPDPFSKRNRHGLSTADFRRMLCDLKSRPASQRAFLRKLLVRALATSVSTGLPVTNHAVPDPVFPSKP